jgi:hypothetical protein
MISYRYRYRPVTVFGSYYTPLPHRYLTVTLPLLTVTLPLLTVTDRYEPFFWKFNIFFNAVLKVAGF